VIPHLRRLADRIEGRVEHTKRRPIGGKISIALSAVSSYRKLTKAAGRITRTSHLVHHLSTTLLTVACFGSSQSSLEVLSQPLISPCPSSSSDPSAASPLPNTPPYPLPKALPFVKLPSRLRLFLCLTFRRGASGTARNRPSNGELSVVAPWGSWPCWKLKKEGIPLLVLKGQYGVLDEAVLTCCYLEEGETVGELDDGRFSWGFADAGSISTCCGSTPLNHHRQHDY
jgi:hypothetical protein